ncbi:hypothetical protein [Albidovulum sp.]|uniref:hypothetical protein n=1 Tax=Albidovulum sp. TaxID=1872424 RepID=UPI0039B892AF
MTTPAEKRQAIEEAAWAAALRLKSFSYYALAADVGISFRWAMEIVRGWQRTGAVELLGPGHAGRHEFRVAPGRTDLPARTRPDGTLIRAGSAVGNMWRTMRALKSFTPTDVMAHSHTPEFEVSPGAAQDYCQMLARSGHLRVMTKALPGRREAIYRLVRDTGPRPPRERRVRAVWDENLGEYTYISGVHQ